MFTKDALTLFLKKHQVALLFAMFVGVIYVAPHILFRLSPDSEYQGIPVLQTANEDYYLTRIREIIDGHYSTGSFTFYEYKDEPSLTPPTVEFIYALPSLLFGVPYTIAVFASKFFLPALLFLLVYMLISALTTERDSFSHRLNAIAGALLVTLGYDLVDYRGIFHLLTAGESTTSSLLLWSRLIHPISGALFLFTFLLLLWSLVNRTEKRKHTIVGAGVCLALMFSSYFFSWGLALSILAIALLIYLVKKQYSAVIDFLACAGVGIFLSIPYWILVFRTTQNPLYKESVLRGGLFYTHYPLFNKYILAVFLLYLLLVVVLPVFRAMRSSVPLKEAVRKVFGDIASWQLFTLALTLGSLGVYLEQVITGITVWPYHFVQYTIPIGVVVLCVLFYNLVRIRFPRTWTAAMLFLSSAALVYGIFIQAYVYRGSFQDNVALEQAAPLFSFLNKKDEPCVVLVNKSLEGGRNWNYLITAFTPCDTYGENGISLIIPYERVLHNLLTVLRLRGITAETLDGYLQSNPDQPRDYLFGNWKGLHRPPGFPDVNDPILEERLQKLPDDFRTFLKKNFRDELKKYRLDYIMSIGPLLPEILMELPGTELIERFGDKYVYRFK